MIRIHMQSQPGTSSTGRSFIRQAAVNTVSAIVSSLEPFSLTVPVFLATAPSVISVIPAEIYRAKNRGDKTGHNNKATLSTILVQVMIFAILQYRKDNDPKESYSRKYDPGF